MASAVIDDMLVDLIGNRYHIPFLTETRYKLELIFRKNLAGRIVRIADDNGFGIFVKRSQKLFSIKRPIGRTQLYELWSCSREHRIRPVVLVIRREDDSFV